MRDSKKQGKNMKKLIVSFACLASLSLLGCGPSEQEIKNLGFSNAAEMKEIQAKGFKTKDEYDQSLVKELGFKDVAEMKSLQEKGFKSKQDYLANEEKLKEEAKAKALADAKADYEKNKQNIDWIAQKLGSVDGAIECRFGVYTLSMFMIKNGVEDSNGLIDKLEKKIDLVLTKYKIEGVTQEDIDSKYARILDVMSKKNDKQISVITQKCIDVISAAPNKNGGI